VSDALPYIIAISFVATLIRSTFGFGESLVAVPLFVLVMPVDTAVPLAVMLSIAVALVVVAQDRRAVHLASAKWLVLFAALGIPLGLALLVFVDERVAKIAIGSLIAAYSIYALLSRGRAPRVARDDRRLLFACGFLSGVLGGAYGLNGPPLVVYGNLQRWDAPRFRATLQAYFLPASALGLAGYAANGLVTRTVAVDFACCLPAVLPAIFLGRYFNGKLRGDRFYAYLYAGLVGVGGLLAVRAMLAV
jgi:hypothetical protein